MIAFIGLDIKGYLGSTKAIGINIVHGRLESCTVEDTACNHGMNLTVGSVRTAKVYSLFKDTAVNVIGKGGIGGTTVSLVRTAQEAHTAGRLIICAGGATYEVTAVDVVGNVTALTVCVTAKEKTVERTAVNVIGDGLGCSSVRIAAAVNVSIEGCAVIEVVDNVTNVVLSVSGTAIYIFCKGAALEGILNQLGDQLTAGLRTTGTIYNAVEDCVALKGIVKALNLLHVGVCSTDGTADTQSDIIGTGGMGSVWTVFEGVVHLVYNETDTACNNGAFKRTAHKVVVKSTGNGLGMRSCPNRATEGTAVDVVDQVAVEDVLFNCSAVSAAA